MNIPTPIYSQRLFQTQWLALGAADWVLQPETLQFCWRKVKIDVCKVAETDNEWARVPQPLAVSFRM